MDRGVDSADVIRRCRDTVGDNWLRLEKHKDEPGELVAETSVDECRFTQLEEYPADLSQKPNAFIVPVPKEDTRATHAQRIFLTDLPREAFLTETSDGETVLDKDAVTLTYRHRSRIETTLQQVKHDFNIPVRDNARTEIKYFCLNMSMLFYNLHNLISNSVSPQFGLPLGDTRGASNGQVLSAIREVAFELAAEDKPGFDASEGRQT